MNASDIVAAKQNRTLFQAYYRPTIFTSSIVYNSTFCPISSIGSDPTSGTYCSSINYLYTCNPTFISYELANDVNSGKYLCGYPSCSSISVWNTGETIPAGVCNCKISYLTWKANQSMGTQSTFAADGSVISSSQNSYAVKPLICTQPEFNQGTNFASRCEVCSNLEGACCK